MRKKQCGKCVCNKELFEELKRIVRCEYISDMRYSPWLDRARRAIARMDLSIYSLFALEDAVNYLYAEKQSFASSEEAQIYFKNKLNSIR